MSAYYNEFDPGKAAWLRELIRRGVISDGEVDERSIQLVQPDDLRGFTRVHCFAGIGIWDYALRQAGWPEDREVWSGSCPCQPFSAAGQRKGKADERHLWPEFFRLIAERRPVVVFGEQVASSDGLKWFDDVHADLGSCDYTIGAAITPACGYGAPHRRERLYFVAQSANQRHKRGGRARGRRNGSANDGNASATMGDSSLPRLEGRQSIGRNDGPQQPTAERTGGAVDAVGDTALPEGARLGSEREYVSRTRGPVNGFWRDAEWIYCRDEKYRAVESTPLGMDDGTSADLGRVRHGDSEITHPLMQGAKRRVLRLRGYGDGIVEPQAEAFVRAYMETIE